MKSKTMRKLRAVTLTELLVVLVIISLLATIAVPVYINQIQRARVSVAQSEVRQIAEAQQHVAITHGFYVPIHILNNVPNLPTGQTTVGFRDDFDAPMVLGQRFVVDATLPVLDQDIASQSSLASTNQRVTRMINEWQGPFLQPKRVRFANETTTPGSGDRTWDIVVDPWGNAYRMYSERGRFGSSTANPSSNEQIIEGLDDLRITTFEQGRFDRLSVVSYGPDGETGWLGGTSVIQGDDIFYAFSGVAFSETSYQNF